MAMTCGVFMKMNPSSRNGVPLEVVSNQNQINLYLRDCVEMKKEPIIQWSHPTGNS
jgi:hypothetical protein